MVDRAFAGKHIVILGLARQGLALARFLAGSGAQVIISDAAPAERLTTELARLNGLSVELALGGHPATLLDGCDLLCLSGGVPPQIPFVQEAIARGIALSNDSLLTCQLVRQQGLGPLVALTGSSGKTTTTTLVGEMLRESFGNGGRRAHVGGNIGTPLLDRLTHVQATDIIVLELSSFQLELWDPTLAYGSLDNLGPAIAAILNITPNHLDRHPSMAAYADAKFNLLRHLKADSQIVLNSEWQMANGDRALNALLADMAAQLATRHSPPLLFSREEPLATGAWLDEDRLIFNGQEICRRDQVKLRGDHNISNLLAAAAISGAAGADISAMRAVAIHFAGVPHRLEVVAEINGVIWINDSIATAPERAVAGLRCFPPGAQTLILLAGGKDKNLPWTTFADEVLARVSYLIGFGDAGPMIVETVQERMAHKRFTKPTCAVVNRLDEAVNVAASIAGPGSVVLLSPGGTSYDAYKNFEQRGEHFRRLVIG